MTDEEIKDCIYRTVTRIIRGAYEMMPDDLRPSEELVLDMIAVSLTQYKELFNQTVDRIKLDNDDGGFHSFVFALQIFLALIKKEKDLIFMEKITE